MALGPRVISNSAAFCPEGSRAGEDVRLFPLAHPHSHPQAPLPSPSHFVGGSLKGSSQFEAEEGETQHSPNSFQGNLHFVSQGILGIFLPVPEMGEDLGSPLMTAPFSEGGKSITYSS